MDTKRETKKSKVNELKAEQLYDNDYSLFLQTTQVFTMMNCFIPDVYVKINDFNNSCPRSFNMLIQIAFTYEFIQKMCPKEFCNLYETAIKQFILHKWNFEVLEKSQVDKINDILFNKSEILAKICNSDFFKILEKRFGNKKEFYFLKQLRGVNAHFCNEIFAIIENFNEAHLPLYVLRLEEISKTVFWDEILLQVLHSMIPDFYTIKSIFVFSIEKIINDRAGQYGYCILQNILKNLDNNPLNLRSSSITQQELIGTISTCEKKQEIMQSINIFCDSRSKSYSVSFDSNTTMLIASANQNRKTKIENIALPWYIDTKMIFETKKETKPDVRVKQDFDKPTAIPPKPIVKKVNQYSAPLQRFQHPTHLPEKKCNVTTREIGMSFSVLHGLGCTNMKKVESGYVCLCPDRKHVN